MPKAEHLFEAPTRAERLAHAMEEASVRAAALNGFSRKLKSLAVSVQRATDRKVAGLEKCEAKYKEALASASPKKSATLAKEAWPEFKSISEAQAREIREESLLMAGIVAQILEQL